MQLPQQKKVFHNFFFTVSKFRFNFKYFHEKITLIAEVFLNLRTPKSVVREMSKKSHLRGPFQQ